MIEDGIYIINWLKKQNLKICAKFSIELGFQYACIITPREGNVAGERDGGADV